MSARCSVFMRRIPHAQGFDRPDHAILSECGRPVERGGVCRYHARHDDLDPLEPSRWRQQLRRIRR